MDLHCDQCEALCINGVPCHETNCPNADVDLRTGRPRAVACIECGCNFEPEERGQTYCGCFGDGPDPVADADLLNPEPVY